MLVIMVFHLILKDHIVILSLVLDYHVHIYYDVGFGGGGVFLPFPIFNLAAAEFCGIQPESLRDFLFEGER